MHLQDCFNLFEGLLTLTCLGSITFTKKTHNCLKLTSWAGFGGCDTHLPFGCHTNGNGHFEALTLRRCEDRHPQSPEFRADAGSTYCADQREGQPSLQRRAGVLIMPRSHSAPYMCLFDFLYKVCYAGNGEVQKHITSGLLQTKEPVANYLQFSRGWI